MPIKKLFTKIRTINQMGHLPRKLIIDPHKIHTFTYLGKTFKFKFPTLRDQVAKLKIELQQNKDKLILREKIQNNKNLPCTRAEIQKLIKQIRKLEVGMDLIKQKELILLDKDKPNYHILLMKYNLFIDKLNEKLKTLYTVSESNKKEIIYSKMMSLITKNLELRKINSRIRMFECLVLLKKNYQVINYF